jgi:hypothetical protein
MNGLKQHQLLFGKIIKVQISFLALEAVQLIDCLPLASWCHPLLTKFSKKR